MQQRTGRERSSHAFYSVPGAPEIVLTAARDRQGEDILHEPETVVEHETKK
jgi:hypothetical protein